MPTLVLLKSITHNLTAKTHTMKPQTDTSSAPKNMPRDIMEHKDPAGTSPDRYAAFNDTKSNDYSQKPDNHTAAEDRMINPERGE